MFTGTRLLVGEHVNEKPERTHIQGDENETPFYHHRLGVVPVLIPRDVSRAKCGEGKPGNKKIIDWPNDHPCISPASRRGNSASCIPCTRNKTRNQFPVSRLDSSQLQSAHA